MKRLAILALPLLLTGCGIGGLLAPAPDDLSSWQAVPLPPDAGLAEAARSQTVCRLGAEQGAPKVVLQDRRTQWTAAFLVADAGNAGSCMLSSRGGGGGGASQPAMQLGALTEPIAVDEQGGGGLSGGIATLLGGRAAAAVAAVRIELGNGQRVEASVGNDHWLGWWPGEARPVAVTAFDAAGRVMVTLAPAPDGWAER